MNVSKSVIVKIGVGILFIILGVLTRRIFHSPVMTLLFHLGGALMIAFGIVQWWTERRL